MTATVLPRRSIVRARWLIPTAGTALDGGWLRLVDGTVVEIGRGPAPRSATDLGDAVVIPGLVNAHTHLEFSALERPLAGDGGLPGWIARLVALRRVAADDPLAREQAIRAGLAESLAAGVTALGEIATAPHSGPDSELPAGASSALPPAAPRMRVYRELLGLGPAALPRARAILAAEKPHRDPRWLPGISPHAPYSVAGPLAHHLLARARRLRLPVATHLAESADDARLIASGDGPFRALLDGLGAWPVPAPDLLPAAEWLTLLARAPRGLVIHATFLAEAGPDALDRLARHRDRLAVAICPRTARLLSGRLPPLARLGATGVRIALGTDGRGSAPDLDPRGECRALVDAGLASPAEALAMATHHAAWGLGMERSSGRLAIGHPADLAVIATGPTGDPHAALLDTSARVVATVIGGRIAHGTLAD